MRGGLPTSGDLFASGGMLDSGEPLGSRPSRQSTTEASLRGALGAELANIGGGRTQLSRWLDGRVAQDQIGDIVLVFSELLTNAVDAAPAETEVAYFAAATAQQIKLTVVNSRSELGPVLPVAMPNPEAECGRGLALAEVYSDKLEILMNLDVIEVCATFMLPSKDHFAG